MSQLGDVIVYLVGALPRPPLRTSLVKFVYLADLIGEAEYGQRVTDIHWRFHDHGPYSPAVVAVAQTLDEERLVTESWGVGYRGAKYWIYGRGRAWQEPELAPRIRSILEDVVEGFGGMDQDALLDAVYEMAPMDTASRGEFLSLPSAIDAFAAVRDAAGARAADCADDSVDYDRDELLGAIRLQGPPLSRRFLEDE